MSEMPLARVDAASDIETTRREFVNALFSVLAGLAIHDLRNASLQRPLKNCEGSFSKLLQLYPGRTIDLKVQDSVLSLCGDRVQNHFSIVEAQKLLIDAFEIAFIEQISFEPTLTMDQLGSFVSKWALHKSVGGKPRPIQGQFEGLKITFQDPDKLQKRLKNKQLLMSSRYALDRYALLKKSTEEFFQGIASNELKSQKGLKRDLLELVEVGRIAPYNLVALSLIRPDEDSSVMSGAISQALSTGLLSAVLAQELHFSFRDQVNIGLVGLLYNVGLIGEETNIILKNEKLSPVEYKRILDAQASGVYKLIKVQGASRPVLERLLSIFEHSKGPQVKSVSLTLESRLLRLVSQYIALTSDRPFRDAYTPFEAIRLLGSKATGPSGGGELDPILYYMFVRFMGVYPVGSLVLLSNNEKAVVYRPSGEKMGVPMVKIVPREGDHAPLVDLGLESQVTILKALDPKREGVRITGYFFE